MDVLKYYINIWVVFCIFFKIYVMEELKCIVVYCYSCKRNYFFIFNECGIMSCKCLVLWSMLEEK